MSEDEDAGARAGAGISTRTVEIAVAAALFVVGAIVVYDSYRLGSKWGSDGPESGYFPFYIGFIICVASMVNAVQALLGKTAAAPKTFVDSQKFKLVLLVLIPALVYALAVQFIGIYIASAVYIAAFMRWLGDYALWKSIAAGLLVNVGFFFLFEVWFKVPLHKGTFDPLSFLGY